MQRDDGSRWEGGSGIDGIIGAHRQVEGSPYAGSSCKEKDIIRFEFFGHFGDSLIEDRDDVAAADGLALQ
jgi:hypothetical protein